MPIETPSNITRNPQLPQHPLGAYTDAQFEAENAALQFETMRQYNELLRQLGYTDPATGQYVPGSVATQAQLQVSDLNRQMSLADQAVTEDMQRGGTLFSGYRATQTAQAEEPFVRNIGGVEVGASLELSDLYAQANDVLAAYEQQQALLLADAASRRAQDIANNPAAPPPADPGAPPPAPAAAPPAAPPDTTTSPQANPPPAQQTPPVQQPPPAPTATPPPGTTSTPPGAPGGQPSASPAGPTTPATGSPTQPQYPYHPASHYGFNPTPSGVVTPNYGGTQPQYPLSVHPPAGTVTDPFALYPGLQKIPPTHGYEGGYVKRGMVM
jgi:hypothetical protein